MAQATDWTTTNFTKVDSKNWFAVNWTTVIDEDWNVDAPITTTNLTYSWTEIQTWITATSWAWAVAITGRIHEVTTTGTWDALTLADGVAGQKLTVIYVAEWAGWDTAILTPTTFAGWSTITFNALGDSADLTFSDTWGWYMHGWTAAVA